MILIVKLMLIEPNTVPTEYRDILMPMLWNASCTDSIRRRVREISSNFIHSKLWIRGAGHWGLGVGGRGQAEPIAVVRSYASCGPGSVGPVGSSLGAAAAVAPAAAGAMEAMPMRSAHAGAAETAGGASR